jgi:TusA-related sulfurtransferase
VSQIFRTLQIGDSLEICWNDPDSPEDLFKILPASSYEVLYMAERNGNNYEYNVKLKKIASSRAVSVFKSSQCAATEHRAIK